MGRRIIGPAKISRFQPFLHGIVHSPARFAASSYNNKTPKRKRSDRQTLMHIRSRGGVDDLELLQQYPTKEKGEADDIAPIESMSSSTQASGAVSQSPKPDYFIGNNGRPVLTSHFTKMHRNVAKSNDAVTNSKLNKCLYNLAVRNGGGAFPTGNGDRHGSIVASSRRVSNKSENDITTTAKYSSTGGRCSVAPSHVSGLPRATYTGRSTIGSTSGWCSMNSARQKSGSFGTHCGSQTDRSRSVTSPSSSRLLTGRSSMQQSTSTTRSGSGHPEVTESSLVLQQQCRYSNPHKLLDNRLTHQRSYDRKIFGYDQCMDQIVLPPLQI
uniref:Uncharacterized protein n=1 Tax=Anopheles culicifacies TaxID=139723 RepID=A0A182MQD1_9DIPT